MSRYNKSFCYEGDIIEYNQTYFKFVEKFKSHFMIYSFREMTKKEGDPSLWTPVMHIELRRHDLDEHARVLGIEEKAKVLLEYDG